MRRSVFGYAPASGLCRWRRSTPTPPTTCSRASPLLGLDRFDTPLCRALRYYRCFVHGFDVSTTVRSFPEHESLPSSLRRSVPPTIRHRYRPTAEGHRVSREKVRTSPSTFSLPLFEIGFRLLSSEWNPGRSIKVHTPPGTSGSTGLRETFQM